jgi:cob(I)alamin adenosyltransferase
MAVRKGYVFVYYGTGKGKTTLAVGQGVRAVGEDLSVVMIQFMDYNNTKETIPLKKLEPEFRVFRFEKNRPNIDNADPTVKKEIAAEVRNAFNFTKKIMDTGECDILIIDGILDAVAEGYITEEELEDALKKKPSYMDAIITGTNAYDRISQQADYVYQIVTEKVL